MISGIVTAVYFLAKNFPYGIAAEATAVNQHVAIHVINTSHSDPRSLLINVPLRYLLKAPQCSAGVAHFRTLNRNIDVLHNKSRYL